MKSYFKSIDNYVEYCVQVYDGTSEDVTLSGVEPFKVEWQNSGNLYTPARYSGATINYVTSDFLWRLYALKPQQIKVKLIATDAVRSRVEWVGYVSPTMYNQSYVGDIENMQVDCVDGLSTLRYIPYTHITKPVAYKHPNNVWSFWDIIVTCVAKAGCYDAIYIADSLELFKGAIPDYESAFTEYVEDDDLTKSLYIPETVFWDKEEGRYMMCDEVLEALCRYLSFTMVAIGDAVYFYDVNAVGRGYGDALNYWKYTNINAAQLTADRESVHISQLDTITGNTHRGMSNISMDKVYSDVSVKPQIKKVEKLFVDFDDADIRSIISYDWRQEDYMYYGIQRLDMTNPQNNKNFWLLERFFSANNWTVHQYDIGWVPGDPTPTIEHPTKYIDMHGSQGAVLISQAVTEKKTNNWVDDYGFTHYGWEIDLKSMSFSDYILMRCRGEWFTSTGKPYAEVSLDDKMHAVLTAGTSAYMILSGSVLLQNISTMYCIPVESVQKGSNKRISLVFMLQIWDHYFNGHTWQTEECTFEVPLDIADGQLMFGNWFDIENNITWVQFNEKLGGNGYVIPLPVVTITNEAEGHVSRESHDYIFKRGVRGYYNVNAKLSIYPPKRPTPLAAGDNLETMFIKDLKCDVYTYTEHTGDMQYKKINDSSFIDSLSEDDMVVNSYDHRNQSYSYVSALVEPATLPKHRYLVMSLQDNTSANPKWGVPEQLRVEKLAKQYKTPKVILQMTHVGICSFLWQYKNSTMGNKYFVCDGMTIDYQYKTSDLKLVEVDQS